MYYSAAAVLNDGEGEAKDTENNNKKTLIRMSPKQGTKSAFIRCLQNKDPSLSRTVKGSECL